MNIQSIYATILGDLAGQPFEYKFGKDLPELYQIDLHHSKAQITDDSILTLASCDFLIKQGQVSLEDIYKTYGVNYPECGFGKGYKEWIKTKPNTVGESWGNGSIMRIAPFILTQNEDLMMKSIQTSHHHPISIQAGKELYDLYHKEKKEVPVLIQPFETFNVKADFAIQTIKAIFSSTKSTHQAIKQAIILGGDTDTHASIVAGLSAHHYSDLTPKDIEYVESKLPKELLNILFKFKSLLQ
ncbi:MAG: ADP-ribosylglycohydrolase family protein [Flavobacteriales bacterium]